MAGRASLMTLTSEPLNIIPSGMCLLKFYSDMELQRQQALMETMAHNSDKKKEDEKKDTEQEK